MFPVYFFHDFVGTAAKKTFINDFILTPKYAAVAKGYSDALVRRRSRVQFPSAALFFIPFHVSSFF